jgi:hypothetical protein
MLSVKVLGPGCANCKRAAQIVELALRDLRAALPDVKAAVEKVADPAAYLDYGLLVTPGLVINERLVSSGRIPSRETVTGWLREALTPGR